MIFSIMLIFSKNVLLESLVGRCNFGLFILLIGFVITLFIAAALILPTSEAQAASDLSAWFRTDGRWAIPFLAFYAFLAYPFNWYLAQLSPSANPASALLIIMMMMTAVDTSSRKALVSVTVLNRS